MTDVGRGLADDGMETTKKLVELEALRGIAAIVVLIHHFMLGFAPRLHGMTYADQPYSLFGTPAFAFVNGSAAVIVFFVLSGFVLSLRVLRTGRPADALTAAFKRWPRLAGPVVLTNAVAGAMMAAGLFSNVETAPTVPSVWLGWFYTWPGMGWREIPASVWEGATTVFTGDSFYNSNLWTMVYEFVGSFVVLAAALLASRLPRFRFAALGAIWLVVFLWSPYVSAFVAGVALALWWMDRPRRDWSAGRSWLSFGIAVLLAGFHRSFASEEPTGIYAWLTPLAAWNMQGFRVLLHTLAAALLILLFLRSAGVRRRLSGRLGYALGYLSFGIYLSQVVVICSVSSAVFVATAGWSHVPRLVVTFLATVSATLMLAVPVAAFDHWWVRWIGARTGAASSALFKKRVRPTVASS